MKMAFAISAALCIGSASMVQAQDYNLDVFFGLSAENKLGWGGFQYDTDSGRVLGLGVSRNDVFVPGLEIGLEYNTNEQEFVCCGTNSMGADTILITARYNLFQYGGFEGYAGLGLGAANVAYKFARTYENSETVAAGQIMLGGRYDVTPASQIFAEYRYLSVEDAGVAGGLGGGFDAEFNSSNIVLGYRYSF
ncbi:Opacity protein [Monaibacterium marinum]|uniref:Opacity protein n=1 Tax=Pontivivens marinum TaxID=1690039 RepID=A0A2C9CSK3_9RHOB|nr:outer membrane beta-barrel protein [Monaibacterium marinum]SOH93359.1 Opacity protein [Monaibacterium marinum]